jgi:hypothetical protein
MKEQNKRLVSRRKFLGTAASAAAFTIIPKNVLGKQFGSVAPSDKIRMAHIGCGMQGHAELGPLMNCPDIQIVAVCDPETDGRHYLNFGNGASVPTGTLNTIRNYLSNPKWREGIKYVPGGRMVMKEVIDTFYANQRAVDKFKAVNAYNDFRELLEKEEIDAVKIMTPDHLHATIAIAAMKKGKHVIVHKPLANRLYESDLVIKTAKETGVATYFMPYNSYRSSEEIKKMVADGAIGTLKEVHEWSARPMWTQNTEMPTNLPPVPAGFDWQMWLGPVPDRPYSPDYTHTLFRGWYDFGGGSFADMGHYTMWTVCDAWDLDVPAWAEGYGSKACRTLNFATGAIANDFSFPFAETIRVHYNAKGSRGPIDVYWHDGGMRPPAIPELEEDKKLMGNTGIMYIGDKGKILDGRLLPESKMKIYMGEKYTPLAERQRGAPQGRPAGNQTATTGPRIGPLPPNFDEWIAACRGGSKNTPANFVSAEALSTMINLGIVAVRAGTRIEFDGVTRQITNNPEANKLLTREYRKGWEL